MVKVAITGHRPEQLNDMVWVRQVLAEVLTELQPDLLFQGMAAGVDLLSAVVARENNINYVACRPWATHTPRVEDEELYQAVLNNAFRVDIVDPADSYVGPWLYHNRNKYMVNNADLLISVWNGSPKGGTAACTKYAKGENKPIIHINPVDKTVTRIEPKPDSPVTEVFLF